MKLMAKFDNWMRLDPAGCIELGRVYTFPEGQEFDNLYHVLMTWRERI
jgi:hypothetical protein